MAHIIAIPVLTVNITDVKFHKDFIKYSARQ